MPGQPDHADVVAEVLAAELRADADLRGELEHLGSNSWSRKPWAAIEPSVGSASR